MEEFVEETCCGKMQKGSSVKYNAVVCAHVLFAFGFVGTIRQLGAIRLAASKLLAKAYLLLQPFPLVCCLLGLEDISHMAAVLVVDYFPSSTCLTQESFVWRRPSLQKQSRKRPAVDSRIELEDPKSKVLVSLQRQYRFQMNYSQNFEFHSRNFAFSLTPELNARYPERQKETRTQCIINWACDRCQTRSMAWHEGPLQQRASKRYTRGMCKMFEQHGLYKMRKRLQRIVCVRVSVCCCVLYVVCCTSY